MKFHDLIVDVCGSKAKSHVLQVLLRFSAKKWTGRELAAESGISTPQTLRALRTFRDFGLVDSLKVGSSILWSLNSDHVLVGLLKPLTDLSSVLKQLILDRLRQRLDEPQLGPIWSVTLYGSVVRGDEQAGSDVDLLVLVRSDQDKQRVYAACQDVTLDLMPVFGNMLHFMVYSKSEYPGEKNPELVRNIEKQGDVFFRGQGVEFWH